MPEALGDLGAEGGGGGAIGVVVGGDGDRGDAAVGALAGGGHGARVDDVDPEVGAVVHARDHEVGAARQEPVPRVERDIDRVGGRAVEGEGVVVDAPGPEHAVQREAVARGALVDGGGAEDHVREAGERGTQRPDPGGEVAVVVAEEDEGAAHVSPRGAAWAGW